MTSYILSGAELEQYFEMDADQLARVRSGEIQNIEIIIDDEKKTASYIEVSNEELHSNTRNENYIDDNYEGVKKFFAEKEETENVDLCPDCSVYCVKRFIDGRCE